MLKLPDVTLVCVETREHDLARMAIEDCLRVAEFGDVLILTDKPWLFAPSTSVVLLTEERSRLAPRMCDQKVRFVQVPDWPDKVGWSRAWWYDTVPHLRTAFTLNIQWDSWIWKPEQWSDDFYKYDYIGAPWWYQDGLNVGNGGFSFVSTRLKRYLRDRRWDYPCDTPVDDDLLCRKFRPRLEDVGFVWSPEWLAHRFAFECCRPAPDSEHFGFHAFFNFSEVLPRGRLLERIQIAAKSPYITKPDGVIWKAFANKHPDLAAAVTQSKDAEASASHPSFAREPDSGKHFRVPQQGVP